jgi:hypothetical protein
LADLSLPTLLVFQFSGGSSLSKPNGSAAYDHMSLANELLVDFEEIDRDQRISVDANTILQNDIIIIDDVFQTNNSLSDYSTFLEAKL